MQTTITPTSCRGSFATLLCSVVVVLVSGDGGSVGQELKRKLQLVQKELQETHEQLVDQQAAVSWHVCVCVCVDVW